MFKSLCLLIGLLSLTAHTATNAVFLPENGRYNHSFEQVLNHLSQGQDYLFLKKEGRDRYKWNSKKNEYEIKNWFERDWYLLQDMFGLNTEHYILKQGGNSFNEAKRRQYAKFAFDKKKFFHYKTVPALKEWGGLSHPPLRQLDLALEHFDSNFKAINYKTVDSFYFNPSLQIEIDQLSNSELSFGNKLEALVDQEAFQKKLALIAKARSSILMSSLVFVCDKGTNRLVDLLGEKYRQGVDVKILVDGFIGRALNHRRCLKKLRSQGIEVVETSDFFRHKLKAIYHTKTLVVDLVEAIAGGHNMIDADNLSRGTDFTNRDVDLYMKGPMVTDVALQFLENWNYQRTLKGGISSLYYLHQKIIKQLRDENRRGLRGKSQYSRILNNPQTRLKGVCRFIKQAPYEDRHSIGKAYLHMLDKVSHHLVIADPIKTDTFTNNIFKTPFEDKWDNFEMFNKLHLKVQALARSGKKIDYITTNMTMAGNENVAIMNEKIKNQLERGDDLRANWSLLKLWASNKYYGNPHYKNLLKDWWPYPNVHIWNHISFMHSKIFYFDRIISSVGSYNFQHNATDHAYESTSICMDEKLNGELDRILVLDMANSIPLIFSRLR